MAIIEYKLYVAIDTQTGALLTQQPFRRVSPNPGEILWVEEATPAYDSFHQDLVVNSRPEPWPYQVGVTQWLHGWTVVEKDLAEVKTHARTLLKEDGKRAMMDALLTGSSVDYGAVKRAYRSSFITARSSINSATTPAAVKAALDGVTWPTGD